MTLSPAQTTAFAAPDAIRAAFAAALSDMYRREVPLYGDLIDLVAAVNADVIARDGGWDAGELARLSAERHGAIRLGTAAELATMARAFAVLGMEPVGYYDLSVAGVPVHSTAFRPVSAAALAANPFRVFTSLLRLELIADEGLRAEAAAILARRQIFTDAALALIEKAEAQGGLTEAEAAEFVPALVETFRWHAEATVDAQTYARLLGQHRLVADVVCFRGPHINHLTPRVLDIDAAQAEMLERGIDAKAVVEGPPARANPILLRQTSFKALSEAIHFQGAAAGDDGRHTARFGEIEQRGLALTPKGRDLYDRLLAQVDGAGREGAYATRLADAFTAFPDEAQALRREGLAYFAYTLAPGATPAPGADLETLVAAGQVVARPIIYEDFLPVSAAGIFQSNLGGEEQKRYDGASAQARFEADLGRGVLDPFALYAAIEAESLSALGLTG